MCLCVFWVFFVRTKRKAVRIYSFTVLEQSSVQVLVLTGDRLKGKKGNSANYLQVWFNRGTKGHGNMCVSENLCTFVSVRLKGG